MNKRNILWIILDSVFIIIFNMFFFVLGKMPHPASVWIAYAFIHFAYLTMIATPFLAGKGDASVSRLALGAVSTGYFVIEFIVGLVIIFISPVKLKASLLTQVVIAAVYVVLLVVNLLANDHTASQSKKI